jgi:Bacterial TniB protein
MNKSQSKFDPNTLRLHVERMLVTHTAFKKALDSLEQAFNAAPTIQDPMGLFIIGESRTGKSRLIEEFMDAHPTIRLLEGVEMPIVKVLVPSKPSVKGLAAEILRALGDPLADKGTEQVMTARLLIFLKFCKVRLLILDEGQHLVDKSSKYTLIHHVSDWLKNLMNQSKVIVVIAGLEYAQTILSQNEQLRGRFANKISMPRFDWREEQSRNEFLGLLAGFNEYMKEQFSLPDLSQHEVALRFYLASGGLTGYVFNILRKTVWNVVEDGRTAINLEDFDDGYQSMVQFQDQHQISPFSRNFKLNDGQVYEKARSIGLRSEDYKPEKRPNIIK